MSATAGTSYRAVLSLPQARRLYLTSSLGRLAYAVLPLALLLTLARDTGSFAVASLVMAAFNTTIVVLGPTRARFIDRYGRRHTLPLMATLFATGAGVLAWCGHLRLPLIALMAIGAVTGAFPPPLGPTMRTWWAGQTPDPRTRQRAYSLDAVTEEILFAAGPALTGLLIGVASSAAAVITGMTLMTVGTLAMITSPGIYSDRRTDPAIENIPKATVRTGSLLRLPRFTLMILVLAGVSVALGGVDVIVPVVAIRSGDAAVAGPLLAAMSVGSAIGGLLYGRRAWKLGPAQRLWRIVLVLAATVAALSLAERSSWALGAGLFIVGLCVSPVLIIAYTLSDRLTPESARTEASSWVNTAGNAGATGGQVTAGLLADHLTPSVLFVLAAAALGVNGLAQSLSPVARRRRAITNRASPTRNVTATGVDIAPVTGSGGGDTLGVGVGVGGTS